MMLIRNADIYNLRAADLRIKQDRIAQIGSLAPENGERVLDAHGGALLPGLRVFQARSIAGLVRLIRLGF